MADSALTDAERKLLEELNARGVRFLIVGASAAVLQGANTATQDVDLWFESTVDPRIGAAIGAVFDVGVHMHGLDPFDVEFERAHEMAIDGVPVRVLPLERIIASKRATGRPRDRAQLPALEEALAASTFRASDEMDRG